MSVFLIRGGNELEGRVDVHGAKNSVLPILAATIVNAGQSVIHNCPNITDVESSLRILRHLGCKAYREGGAVIVDSSSMNRFDVPDCLMREMRSSVVFLGAILARCRRAVMSFPGGCSLGPRPIDMHLSAFRLLGTDIVEEGGEILCHADKLSGREINLSFPSVGATENIMLAACGAEGQTIITNAAREPEIEDLQNFLVKCGAGVSGAGTSTVVIEGGRKLKPAEHTIIPDRIVASTLLAAAAMTGGDVTLRNVITSHFSTVDAILSEAGCDISQDGNEIRIRRTRQMRAVRPIRTMPYPGFPTDAQSPLMAALTKAGGTTVFVENIFDNRYRHVGELARMGADIRVEGRVAVVCGVDRLYGAKVASTDLRGGAALVVAALGAEGESYVSELQYIDRGYDKLENMLKGLGADIQRVREPECADGR